MNKETEQRLGLLLGITYTPDGTASGPDGPFEIPTVHVDAWDMLVCTTESCYEGEWYLTLGVHPYSAQVSVVLRDHHEPDAGYHLGDVNEDEVIPFIRDIVRCRWEPEQLIQRADSVEPAQ